MDSPPKDAFDRFVRIAAAAVQASIGVLSLLDDRREFIKSSIGLSEPWASSRIIPLSHSLSKHVVTSAAPLVVIDARNDPLLHHSPAVHEVGIVAYLGVPLLLPEAHVVGCLSVAEDRPRAWRLEDRMLLNDVAMAAVTEMQLRSVHERYENLLDQAADIIYRTDDRGRFTDVNSVALNLLGYTRDELIGCYYRDLIRADHRPAARQLYEGQFADGISSTYYEFPALKRDGGEVWIGQNVQLILEDRRPIGFRPSQETLPNASKSKASCERRWSNRIWSIGPPRMRSGTGIL